LIAHRAPIRPLPWKLCAGALIVLLGVVLCGRLSHPWTYNDDYNGAFWSQAARNFSQAGYLTNAGVPAPLYFGPPPVPTDQLYVHHPTLLAAMMLADRALLGESERAARALPIFFSLLTAALLYLYISYSLGWRAGAFVLGFFIAAPMELHYGQMVNFEAPELFFLLGAFCCFHLWQLRHSTGFAAGLLVCSALAMWTDWQGYLLVIWIAVSLLLSRGTRNGRLAVALLLTAFLSGIAFLVQIHLAVPGAWQELHNAFRERSGHADLSGGNFTATQWLRTEYGYLTSLFHPVAWLMALAGAGLAVFDRRRLSPSQASSLHLATAFFFIDAFYICALRNQSYIHDFAGFYFLIPVAIFSGYLVERIIRSVEGFRPGIAATAVGCVCCSLTAGLIWSGIRSLDNIDTQFCILDDDNSEPATLMPDVGRIIDRSFPPDTVVICNFDQYYSPLPFYARREMTNDVRTYADWQHAVSDAAPRPAGGIIWSGAADATDLLHQLPIEEMRRVTVDGIPFVLWLPRSTAHPS
jgi:4-amino-4-deoxy-L-arabinose transferase-like glycosyltransferase